MISAITLLFAISTTIGPANTVKYPEWAVDPVKEKYIPYPLFDAYDASTGGWTSGRITDSLGTAMYASLDAILQRRIFPFWYPWGAWRNLTVDAVCSTDFMPFVPSSTKARYEFSELFSNRSTTTLFFTESFEWYLSATASRDQDIYPDDPLGIYTYATNRDFSAHGRRIYAANAAADYAVTNGMVGLVASLDKSGTSAAHYWMNPDTLGGLTSTEFAIDPLPHAGWDSNGLFLFLGDYATTNYFPANIFSRSAYSDMRGVNPSWARKFHSAKNLDNFYRVFSEERERSGGRSTNSISTLINGGRGVGLIKNVYRRKPTPRIVLDRFALLNSAASLCQTAFLGTKVCDASQMAAYMPMDYGKTLFPTQPVPAFRFKSNASAFSGSLVYTNTFPTNVKFAPSTDSTTPEKWTAKFDVNAMIDAAQVQGKDIVFKTDSLSVTTGCVSSVSAAWYDETVYASLSTSQSFDLLRSNFTVTVPTTGILDNPFENDPDAAKGKWRLDTIVGEKGDVTWILSADMIQVDGEWVPDPKAVFADGSTSKTIGEGTLSFEDDMTSVLMDFHFTWRLDFNGRDLPDSVMPYIGPTCHDASADAGNTTNTVMSLTYAPQLYEAGLVETWIDAYTTVGVSANRDDVVGVLENGVFDFLSGFGNDRAKAYSKYTTAPYRIGSTAGWRGTWMSLYDFAEVGNEIDECIGYLLMDATGSRLEMETYLPTLKTCLAGYGESSKTEANFAKVKNMLASSTNEGIYPASLSITARPYTGIVNGEIPYDWTCGSISLTINIPVTVDDARRSSVAVAYEKQGLPFAEFKFPAMSVPSAATADGTSGTAGSTE